MAGNRQQNYINHIALVLDASGSMDRHREQLIKVADDQIAYLAQRSKDLDQETRVTVYSFDNTVECLVYDKDVLRLPSIRQLYRIGGMTALIDATLKSQDDLAHTWEGYGDHSFLTFVLTDGAENASTGGSGIGSHYLTPSERQKIIDNLASRLTNLPDHWTVAVLVPDQVGKREAMKFGFPRDNIAIWDATSSQGVEEAVSVIRTATDTYMTGRAKGVRGTRSLFVGGQVDAAAIKSAKLKPLDISEYAIVPVTRVDGLVKEKPVPGKKPTIKQPVVPMMSYVEIEPFINRVHPPFRVGKTYYELVKTERIEGNKRIAVVETKTNRVYVGEGARKLLGMKDEKTTVKPDANPLYKVYVESTSLNRHLPVGSSVMVLTK